MTHKLTFPAPKRCSYNYELGWADRAYTVEDIISAKEGGAWFVKGRHDFADMAAAKAAGVAPEAPAPKVIEVEDNWIDELVKHMTPAERKLVLAQLQPE